MNNVLQILKIDTNIKNVVKKFISCIFLFWLLLFLSSFVSSKQIHKNISNAANGLKYPSMVCYDGEDRPDNAINIGVDAVILNFLLMQNKQSPLFDSLIYQQYVPPLSKEVSDINPQSAYLIETTKTTEFIDSYITQFAGYWLGYMAFLKPLLCFFEYGAIVKAVSIISIFMCFAIIVVIAKKMDKLTAVSWGGVSFPSIILHCVKIFLKEYCVFGFS